MVIDIIIIAVMAGAIFLGVKKGLISCLIDVLAVIIALVLAIMLCKPISNFIIKNTNFDETIKNAIVENIPLNDADFKVQENANLPKPVVDYINGITENASGAKDEAINTIANELTSGIIMVIAFVGIFIIVRLVLVLIKIVSKLIDKIPGLKQINKLGGGICGAVEGAIIVYAIFAVISIISPMIAETNIIELIQESNIGSAMYNNNAVLKFIYK